MSKKAATCPSKGTILDHTREGKRNERPDHVQALFVLGCLLTINPEYLLSLCPPSEFSFGNIGTKMVAMVGISGNEGRDDSPSIKPEVNNC